MTNDEPLAAELRRAEKTLESTLQEACGADVRRADTGELIKVEEMLSIASDAAKRAISIRRKQGQAGAAPGAGIGAETTEAASTALAAADHRRFVDASGVEWLVRAVYPADRDDARHARLLGTFQQGWLAFESDQGKRRLSPIPDDWADGDDASLRALCERAEVAPVRREDRPS